MTMRKRRKSPERSAERRKCSTLLGYTAAELRPSAPGAEITEGGLLNDIVTEKKLRAVTGDRSKIATGKNRKIRQI